MGDPCGRPSYLGDNMKIFSKFKSNEFKIIIVLISILTIGLIALTSASNAVENGYGLITKQLVAIIIGIIAASIVISIDYEVYLRYWFVFYAVSIILLILVLFTASINNARSWFQIKELGLAFQPSEITKIILIIMTAKLLANMKRRSMSSKTKTLYIFGMTALIALPIILIIIQPDFGTAMVILVSILSMIFVWGIDFKYIKYAIISFVLATPLVYFFLLKPGQKERILVFLDPLRDPTGSGYHVLQSKLAIGAGGLGGSGMFNGVQTQMGYLYAQTTDFIFAAISEEMGFFIAAFLIILLIALVILCLSVANEARDEEGKLIVVGLSIMFAVHIVINVGMTMGLTPITGIPLPFVSYGGSSMLTNMIAIGIILGVGFRKTGLRF